MVGLTDAADANGRRVESPTVTRTGDFGGDVVVRHIVGLDPGRGGVAVAAPVQEGMELAFCQRNVQAARADLMRVCAEIREELEPQEQALESATALAASEAEAAPHPARGIAGAIYVSCAGRGGNLLGGPAPRFKSFAGAWVVWPWVGCPLFPT